MLKAAKLEKARMAKEAAEKEAAEKEAAEKKAHEDRMKETACIQRTESGLADVTGMSRFDHTKMMLEERVKEWDNQQDLQVLDVKIAPNHCKIDEAVHVLLKFRTLKPLKNCVWDVKYVVDFMNKGRKQPLGTLEVEKYEPGDHEMRFSCTHIDLSLHRKSAQLNVGLLWLQLLSNGEETFQMSFVSQVTKSKGDILIRNICNPVHKDIKSEA